MRYIIYGAGGIGGVIGGRLFQAGHEVVLIARGAHLAAIQERGLRLRTPDGEYTLPVPAVAHPRDINFRADDAVFLTMKTQDTTAALADLERAAGADLPIICCQNGVENERLASRRFARVYAMLVAMPATFLEPGCVDGESEPISGVLDTGCYPGGVDTVIEQVAADIRGSQMSAYADPKPMRKKYTKLLSNLGNAVQVVTGLYRGTPEFSALLSRLRAEAEACYHAAGIEHLPEQDYNTEVRSRYRMGKIAGAARGGSSTWQSLARGQTTVETDYLNGEVVLLGKLHGVPTPLNATVRRLANQIAAAGATSGQYSIVDIERLSGEGVPA